MLTWNRPMTSEQAAKYLLTGGFVAVELYNAELERHKDALLAAKEAVGNVTISACDMLGGYELLSGAEVRKRAVSAIDALIAVLQPNMGA